LASVEDVDRQGATPRRSTRWTATWFSVKGLHRPPQVDCCRGVNVQLRPVRAIRLAPSLPATAQLTRTLRGPKHASPSGLIWRYKSRSMSRKASDHNGYQRITRLTWGVQAGLKILVSAVQSRPSPPFFSATCSSENFSPTEFVPRFVPNSGTLQRIPAHEGALGYEHRPTLTGMQLQ
jgi:hypothetical protein